MEAVLGAAGVAAGTLLFALGHDRFPRLARAIMTVALLFMVAGLVIVASAFPWVVMGFVLLFVVLSYLTSWAEASGRWKATPATQADIAGWGSTAKLLVSLGWVFTDAWVLEINQARPTFLSFERYPDGTRVTCVGRHENGGVMTVETFLDGGHGMLVTVRRRSSTLSPPWMFRQALDVPVEELLRYHDEALFRLRVEGIEPAPPFPGDGVAFEKYGNRKLCGDITRRWYLWALRPIVTRVLPSRRAPLSEQTDLDRQLDRYRRSRPEASAV